jgi:hypothetical protein
MTWTDQGDRPTSSAIIETCERRCRATEAY